MVSDHRSERIRKTMLSLGVAGAGATARAGIASRNGVGRCTHWGR
jgi:hypothetical protein